MATIDTLITDLQTYTSAGSTRLPDADCTEFINATIRRLQRIHPWLGEQHTVDLTVGTGGVAVLPADFIHELGVWQKDTSQTDPAKALTEIQRTSRAAWVRSEGDAVATADAIYPSVAQPGSATATSSRYYYLWNGTLAIVPTPTSAITVTLDYIRTLPELVDNSGMQNVFTLRFPDLVRTGALAQAYRYLHEWEVAALHEQLFAAQAKEGISQDEAQSFAGAAPKTRGL